jgi:DNA-binding transcriptional MerR regulator
MTRDELLSQIKALRGIVAMGQDKLRENLYLDMEMIQGKLDEACEAVVDFSAEDAAEVREPLSTLINDLKSYSNTIGELQDNLNNEAENNDTASDQ